MGLDGKSVDLRAYSYIHMCVYCICMCLDYEGENRGVGMVLRDYMRMERTRD